jgi:hypothetical protein
MTAQKSTGATPVRAKVVLVDPAAMTVIWANEAAAEGSADGHAVGLPVAQVLALADEIGIPEAVRDVAATGVSRHVRTSLVHTARGGLEIVTSIYRLPDGGLLLVTENAFDPTKRPPRAQAGERRRRETR